MKNKITVKQIIGLFFFLVVFLVPLSYFYFSNRSRNIIVNEEYIEKDAVYGVNTYETVAISNDKVATIYYTEYLNLLRNDPKSAYQKLDSESKKEKFPDYNDFLAFSLSHHYSYQVRRVVTLEEDDCYIYTIYDEEDHVLTITATSVMNYTVNIT